MSAHRLNVALIGAGRIGRIHAENIATRIRNARLTAIADIDLANARRLADRFGVPVATADYSELLTLPGIDAVVIASPTETHARIVREAAACGKHVFCEKPIDLNVECIEKSLAVVDTARVKLQVGFNRRFDPSFARARELVANGSIGAVQIVRITSRDPMPPPLDYARGSGGIFLDMTIHDFDMVRFLTGTEVVEVFAAGSALIDPALKEFGDVDTCVLALRLKNGAMATIDNSRLAVYGYDQRIEVFGSAGMVSVANRTTDTHIHMDADGAHMARPQDFFIDRYAEALLAEMQSFVECVLTDTKPAVSGLDGLAATVIGVAATRSLAENRPVQLSEICQSCLTCREIISAPPRRQTRPHSKPRPRSAH